MAYTLHTYVLLHCYSNPHIDVILPHIPVKQKQQTATLCFILLSYVYQQIICPSNARYMPHIQFSHHSLGGKYANMHVINEFSAINDVARSAVHRWQWQWSTMNRDDNDNDADDDNARKGCIWLFDQMSQKNSRTHNTYLIFWNLLDVSPFRKTFVNLLYIHRCAFSHFV